MRTRGGGERRRAMVMMEVDSADADVRWDAAERGVRTTECGRLQ